MDITPSLHLWRFMMTGDNLNDYALEVFLAASVIPEPGTCPDTVRAAKLEAVFKGVQRISFIAAVASYHTSSTAFLQRR